MHNRILNINGRGNVMLNAAVRLAFTQAGVEKAIGYRIHDEYGYILYATTPTGVNFTSLINPVDASAASTLISIWLVGQYMNGAVYGKAGSMDLKNKEEGVKSEHGFRLYVERYGLIDGDNEAICAVIPAAIWTANPDKEEK